MKKALSLILALVMIFAMTTVAFAEEDDNVEPVIGNHTNGTGLQETDAWPEGNTAATVTINVKAVETVHKYAVDVSWSDQAIALGGATMTWNVKTMRYDTPDPDTSFEPVTWNIKVTNYSDLSVYAYASISDPVDDNMEIISTYVSDNRLEVKRAEAGVGVDGEGNPIEGNPTIGLLKISLQPVSGKTWGDVAEYYTINHPNAESVTAGTATVYIAKTGS